MGSSVACKPQARKMISNGWRADEIFLLYCLLLPQSRVATHVVLVTVPQPCSYSLWGKKWAVLPCFSTWVIGCFPLATLLICLASVARHPPTSYLPWQVIVDPDTYGKDLDFPRHSFSMLNLSCCSAFSNCFMEASGSRTHVLLSDGPNRIGHKV